MPSPRRFQPDPMPAGRAISRRTFAAGALSTAVLAALSACGADSAGTGSSAAGTSAAGTSAGPGSSNGAASSGSATSGAASSDAPRSDAASSSSGSDFPVSIKHQLGTAEIPAAPTRVVSVGLTEHDFLLALGIAPVGVTDWYGDQPSATWPWAQAALGDATPTVLSDADGIQFLEVAKLKPDLIIGLNSGMSQEDYAKLSQIAPTVATPSEAGSEYFDSWTLYLRVIGEAVGKSVEAAALETSIKKQFADAAAAHPEFAGKNAIFLQNAVSDGNFLAYEAGLGTEFLTDLGFTVPTEIEKYVPAEGGQALIPTERIEVLNSGDYLIWGTEKDEDRAALEKVPGFKDLTAVTAGRSVYTGGVLAGAIYFSSPLSLPYVVEKLVPLLAAKS